MPDRISIIPAELKKRKEIFSLLEAENLPVNDISADLKYFVIAQDNETIIGNIGLEIYQSCGLLRSLVVKKEYRGQGIADKLVTAIEDLAKQNRIERIYLLTETAPLYFEKKGYLRIQRADVPDPLLESSEFSYACPQSAIVMRKEFI